MGTVCSRASRRIAKIGSARFGESKEFMTSNKKKRQVSTRVWGLGRSCASCFCCAPISHAGGGPRRAPANISPSLRKFQRKYGLSVLPGTVLRMRSLFQPRFGTQAVAVIEQSGIIQVPTQVWDPSVRLSRESDLRHGLGLRPREKTRRSKDRWAP